MISDSAKAAFRRRASLPATFNDFSPGYVARLRSFAAAIGGSDPFAEPAAPAPIKPVGPAPRPVMPPAAPPTEPTAVDVEFDRVRSAALARPEAERRAEADSVTAANFIVASLAKARA